MRKASMSHVSGSRGRVSEVSYACNLSSLSQRGMTSCGNSGNGDSGIGGGGRIDSGESSNGST